MSLESEVDRLKKNLDRERITVRLQQQTIQDLENKLREYQDKSNAETPDELELEESQLLKEQSARKVTELETIIKENNQQLLALRNNIQAYEKQVTENHQEIYRLQDVIRELQSSLTEKSSMINSQAMSILSYKHQIQKLQKKLELPIHSNSKSAMKPYYRKSQPLKQHTINSTLMRQQQQQKPTDTQPSSSSGKENEIIEQQPRLQPLEKLPISTSSEPTESTRARHERIHMHGETCVACEKFYDTTPLPDVHDQTVQYTASERIQLHSRHRHRQRATTPPGFWDMEFGSPEIDSTRHIRLT
ncbi:hypothetical protein BCV72DRAFT_5902 [Rhizopus microsporus var. microsporus]|uniref:DNA endonuclease activator Ctp1 C-terminal domain-containing protein n=2 Tax=Rhizopus microsporus TaxID=58291 RepID=A0A2G4SFN0_RHIZD|nr:uncharacterized protein RHIMIDRAFT_242549 [Rhizopus microsporus ATCC 52813]ORE05050.1 hypothetical protein BCV72DRAFT_5902 [Rhizopus microsporus var. microsporus]PHZ07574.1 hypothetical protein RHIMIDRAFT_242549 [Rhizopus microsporus ATCC 52813]